MKFITENSSTYLSSTSIVRGVCTWVGTTICAANNLIWTGSLSFVFVTLHTNKCMLIIWNILQCVKSWTKMVC